MDALEKAAILGQAAQYDLCSSYLCSPQGAGRRADPSGRWIYPAVLPDGRHILLLKVLLSNACQNDCAYCANRCPNEFRRVSFQSAELARLFIEMRQAGLVQGLFLSSAVEGSPTLTMDRMLATVEILRLRYQFRGYIHLKILPGATFDYVEQAVRLADRVSVNLEAPNPKRLRRLCPGKDFERDLLRPLRWVKALSTQGNAPAAGQTTQFVVGAADESDREILDTTSRLYAELGLKRAYFSAFQPLPHTPLAGHPPTPLLREHRLYQADFLFRRYDFKVEELIFDGHRNLPLEADPKQVWAWHHPECFPLEVNTASPQELLRVPGIGPISAKRLIKARRQGKIKGLEDLKALGVVTKRAAAYLLLSGRQAVKEEQTPLPGEQRVIQASYLSPGNMEIVLR
ncbi:MAG: putative DNA modification/repair radical SAM protein [Chloroflexi bacterium]|nr:putative DNA modification/repair radical SAM protein [Chloroflexota bacterium]